ncbi:hypothetical protein C8J56DRAFT_172944 [Mycena floridula]|nr:hypothetical protein C8J56DRAFT_172944 [Mycena floridula]
MDSLPPSDTRLELELGQSSSSSSNANDAVATQTVPNFPFSPIFYPGADSVPGDVKDLTIVSNDSVVFCVCSSILIAASNNRFGGLDSSPYVQPLSDSASTVNIILHLVHDMPLSELPTFDTLRAVVHRLPVYGLAPKAYISPTKPLFEHFLSYAAIDPWEVYALAAIFDIHELAVAASSYLLSSSLATLTDEMAQRIGSVYLNRLVRLHLKRMERLKRLILSPPHLHPQTDSCSSVEQREVISAWTMKAAALAWEANPGLSPTVLESSFGTLTRQISCLDCQKQIKDQVRKIVIQWMLTQVHLVLGHHMHHISSLIPRERTI